jgi:hypothetical protein
VYFPTCQLNFQPEKQPADDCYLCRQTNFVAYTRFHSLTVNVTGLIQNHLLSYIIWYYTGRLALIMYSYNYYKVNIHMYDSVKANLLKHSLLNFSIKQIYKGWRQFMKIIHIES